MHSLCESKRMARSGLCPLANWFLTFPAMVAIGRRSQSSRLSTNIPIRPEPMAQTAKPGSAGIWTITGCLLGHIGPLEIPTFGIFLKKNIIIKIHQPQSNPFRSYPWLSPCLNNRFLKQNLPMQTENGHFVFLKLLPSAWAGAFGAWQRFAWAKSSGTKNRRRTGAKRSYEDTV